MNHQLFFVLMLGLLTQTIHAKDTLQVKKLLDLAKDHLYIDPNLSLNYTYEAINLSKDLNQIRWEGKSLSLCGLYNLYQGEYSLGREMLEASLSKLLKKGSSQDILEVNTHFGVYYYLTSKYDTAIKILTQVIKSSLDYKNIESEEYARNFISSAFLQAGYYENVIKNGLRLLELKDILSKSKVDIFSEIADTYAHRKDFTKAHQYYLFALDECLKKENEPASLAFCYQNYGEILMRIDSLDKANKMFQKALRYIEDKDYFEELAIIYLNLGNCLLKQKNYAQSEFYFQQSEKICAKRTLARYPLLSKAGMVKIFFELKQDSLCIELGKTVIAEAQILREKPLILELSLLLSQAYTRLKQHEKAAQYLNLHITYNDSLFWIEKERAIRDMQIKYEVEITELENQKLIFENDLNESRFYNTLLIAFFLSIVLFLILGITLRFRKLNLKLDGQNKIIVNQYEHLVRLDGEKNFMISFITHDLRNLLHRLFGYIYIIREFGGLKEQQKFQNMFNGLMATEQEIKSLVNNTLDSQMLEEGKIILNFTQINLVELLDTLIENLNFRSNQKNINLKFFHSEKEILIKTDEVVLERILDNLISNAIKFSPFDSQVSVSVHQDDEKVKIWIQDQGPGFSEYDTKYIFSKFKTLTAKPTNDETSTGLGLSIVKAMSEKLKIEINYGNLSPKGAFFVLLIPKQEV